MNNLYPNSSYVWEEIFSCSFFFHMALDYITVSLVSLQIITHISWFRLRKRIGIGSISLDFFTATFCHQIFYFLFLGPTSPSGAHV